MFNKHYYAMGWNYDNFKRRKKNQINIFKFIPEINFLCVF